MQPSFDLSVVPEFDVDLFVQTQPYQVKWFFDSGILLRHTKAGLYLADDSKTMFRFS